MKVKTQRNSCVFYTRFDEEWTVMEEEARLRSMR